MTLSKRRCSVHGAWTASAYRLLCLYSLLPLLRLLLHPLRRLESTRCRTAPCRLRRCYTSGC